MNTDPGVSTEKRSLYSKGYSDYNGSSDEADSPQPSKSQTHTHRSTVRKDPEKSQNPPQMRSQAQANNSSRSQSRDSDENHGQASNQNESRSKNKVRTPHQSPRVSRSTERRQKSPENLHRSRTRSLRSSTSQDQPTTSHSNSPRNNTRNHSEDRPMRQIITPRRSRSKKEEKVQMQSPSGDQNQEKLHSSNEGEPRDEIHSQLRTGARSRLTSPARKMLRETSAQTGDSINRCSFPLNTISAHMSLENEEEMTQEPLNQAPNTDVYIPETQEEPVAEETEQPQPSSSTDAVESHKKPRKKYQRKVVANVPIEDEVDGPRRSNRDRTRRGDGWAMENQLRRQKITQLLVQGTNRKNKVPRARMTQARQVSEDDSDTEAPMENQKKGRGRRRVTTESNNPAELDQGDDNVAEAPIENQKKGRGRLRRTADSVEKQTERVSNDDSGAEMPVVIQKKHRGRPRKTDDSNKLTESKTTKRKTDADHEPSEQPVEKSKRSNVKQSVDGTITTRSKKNSTNLIGERSNSAGPSKQNRVEMESDNETAEVSQSQRSLVSIYDRSTTENSLVSLS